MKDKTVDSKLVDKISQNPMLLWMLSDRVYELMLEDLRNQRDRSSSLGGRSHV